MLFLDDLLLSPLTGFKFILRTLQRVALRDYSGSGSWRNLLAPQGHLPKQFPGVCL